MKIIGRVKEQAALNQYYTSGAPEFLAVYGRRRVGKTFLIREFFKDRIDFYTTGLANGKREEQLKIWNDDIKNCFGGSDEYANNWLDAFTLLRRKLEESNKSSKFGAPGTRGATGTRGYKPVKANRKVLFIDEAPWMDTQKSGFLTALEYFWNSWASGQPDIFLIICGSATSWIVNNLLKNKGGLYNRVTRRMRLLPFTLNETEAYLNEKEINIGRYKICEAYMIFGGVPYYLSLLGKGLSLPQNIDALCFYEDGQLRDEFEVLFSSLYKNSELYIKVVTALCSKIKGLTRDEIIKESGMSSGGGLTKILEELELCGFIRSYPNFSTNENLNLYQLTDPFSLFHLCFIGSKRPKNPLFWTANLESPAINAWKGYAFEQACLLHTEQIKQALGVGAISTEISSWRSRRSSPGAQIDLLIDRKDGIINLCEMKYGKAEYTISASEEKKLRNRISVFEAETHTKKSVHLTIVTTYGITHNAHSGIVQSEVTLDDLFKIDFGMI